MLKGMGALSFSFNSFGLAALAASALAVFLVAEGLSRRKARGAKVFAALMGSVFVYCFGTAFEFMGRDLGTVLLCTHFEYFGLSLLPTMIILTALDFCGLWPRDRGVLFAILFTLSAVTLGMQLTTETHRLYYIDPVLRSDGPIPILVFGKGPFYLGYQIYLIASLLALVALVVRQAIISSGSLRAQALLMLSSFAFPISAFSIYAWRLSPWGIDLTPLSFPLMGLVISFGLFRFRLFDLEPIALRAVFRTMSEGCIIVDAKDRLIDFNESARAILPRLSEARIGADSAVVFSDRPKLLEFVRGNADDSLEILVGEGESSKCYDIVTSLIRDHGDRVVGKTIVVNDTSRQYRLALHLQELATRDSLTGLYNRRSFLDLAGHFVDQAARNDRSISFIMLDIDHFKRVNDDHGHLVGDRVLAEVARRCLHAVRSSDIVCRFGGEEFVIMLPETAEEGALLLCERILDEIKDKPIIVDDAAFKMTASLGLAVSRSPVALGTEEILRRADQAMYEAKRAGRCRVHRFEDRPEASVD